MGGEYRTRNYLDRILQDRCSEPRSLPLEDLRKITNNFSDDKLLGEGGFGKVYKGVLPTGEMIAVKKLVSSMPGVQDKQFENEAHHLMRLKHPNIVQLVGYCSETENILVQHNGRDVYAERSERLLCLEYLPKGSLFRHLTGECSGLDWDTRYKIIEGICYGLHYLHEEWQINTPIIHMDLKPANILLGDNMVPKIADFGLSRLFGKEKTRTCTQSRDGTLGYMAPEYINRGIITKKLDIFSLGVIIIEIITGYRDYPDETGTSSQQYIELVLKNWRSRLENAPGYTSQRIDYLQIRRCIEIGLSCVKPDRKERPTTGQIIKMLRGSESADFRVGDAVIQHLANTSGAKKTYMSLEKDGQPKRRCLGIDLNRVEADTMEQSEKNFVDLRLRPSASQDNITGPSPNHHNHERLARQGINQQVTNAEAEGLAATESEGKDASLRLRFLCKMEPPVYHDDEIKFITIGIYDRDTMIKAGPFSNVKVEVLALEGSFPYDNNGSWTPKEFDKHIAYGRDGKGSVLTGKGTNAQLIMGMCHLGSIRFREGSCRARNGKFIIGARVCDGQAICGRVQEAVMNPVVVQDRRNKYNEKIHPPNLDNEVYRLEKIAKNGKYHKRLEQKNICTVEHFLKALYKDEDNLTSILKINKKCKDWDKMVEHAQKCCLKGKPELKSYRCKERNVVLFFNYVHRLVGAKFGGPYIASEKFEPAQKNLVDKLKKNAYDQLDGLTEDHVMKYNIPVPICMDADADAGPSCMPSATQQKNSVGGTPATQVLSPHASTELVANDNNAPGPSSSVPDPHSTYNYQVRGLSHGLNDSPCAIANNGPGPSLFVPDQLRTQNHQDQETRPAVQEQHLASIDDQHLDIFARAFSFGATDAINIFFTDEADASAFLQHQADTNDYVEMQPLWTGNDTLEASPSADINMASSHISMALAPQQLTSTDAPGSAQGSVQGQTQPPLPNNETSLNTNEKLPGTGH